MKSWVRLVLAFTKRGTEEERNREIELVILRTKGKETERNSLAFPWTRQHQLPQVSIIQNNRQTPTDITRPRGNHPIPTLLPLNHVRLPN